MAYTVYMLTEEIQIPALIGVRKFPSVLRIMLSKYFLYVLIQTLILLHTFNGDIIHKIEICKYFFVIYFFYSSTLAVIFDVYVWRTCFTEFSLRTYKNIIHC